MDENTHGANTRTSTMHEALRQDGAGPSLFMSLRAENADDLIGFLTEAFGFVQTARYMDGDKVAHAELQWPDGRGGIMLGDCRETDDPVSRPGGASAYIVTSDPDAQYERAVSRGAQVVMAPDDTPYGSREFAVRDPEGNMWSFGSYAGEALPA